MKMKKILKFLLWSFVSLVTAVALLYAWVDWSGARAWKKVEAELLAKGEPLRLEQIIPPPIPDEQNFAFSPLFKDVFETEAHAENGRLVYRPKHREDVERLEAMGLPGKPPRLSRLQGAATDLVAWQTYFRASTEFHLPENLGSPAAEVLGALEHWKVPLDEIARELRARPLMRAPISYEQLFAITFPHLTSTINLGKLYQLRATARIRQGQSTEAFGDLESLFLLRKVMEPRQTIVGNTVAAAITTLTLSVIREGLEARIWDETQLINLSLKLELLNPIADFSGAIRSERVLFLETTRRMPEYLEKQIAFPEETPRWWRKIAVIGLSSPPRGFWGLDRAAYGRLTQQLLEEFLDPKEGRIHFPAYRESEAESARLKTFPARIGSFQTSIVLPVLRTSAMGAAQSSAHINAARVAIAVERYRVMNSSIPENLAALVPEFINQIPHDPIDGKPLRYQKMSEREYRIWSIGWDEKDGGGVAGAKSAEGDWLWTSLPPHSASGRQ